MARHVLLALSLAGGAAAQAVAPFSFVAECGSGAATTPLEPFWRSVGYTPAEYALRGDELENTALIGAVPGRGVTQMRVHYLLDLVMVLGWVQTAGATPSGWTLSYDWSAMDYAMDWMQAQGLQPGFEMMGSPMGFPAVPAAFWTPFNGNGQILPNQTFAMWRQLVGDLLLRYIGRYGADEVQRWHLESWNEPDVGWGWLKVQNSSDPTLRAYELYWDATAAGVEDAEAASGARLMFGGSASGAASRDQYFLPTVLDKKATGRNVWTGAPGRLDYVSAHVKGQSTSYVTVQGEWAVSALIRSNPAWATPNLTSLAVSNDEGDPAVGWQYQLPWRADAHYSALQAKMVNQHLLTIADNTTVNPLGWLSFDAGFMNGASDTLTTWQQRTMAIRFGNHTANAPVAFVRKPGLAGFTMLSKLYAPTQQDATLAPATRCAYTGDAATGVASLFANAGGLATAQGNGAAAGTLAPEVSILVYNSADCNTTANSPTLAVNASVASSSLAPAPADGSVVAVLFVSDNAPARNPSAAWAAMGGPERPSPAQLQALWTVAANMTTAAAPPLAVAVGAGGAVVLPPVQLALPGAALWHIAARPAAPPPAPAWAAAYAKPANGSLLDAGSQREVLVRWDCAGAAGGGAATRVALAWLVQFSASGSAAGPWATVAGGDAAASGTPGDIMCAFVHAAPAPPGGAGAPFAGAYRVAAVDYWRRQGAWSTVAAAAPWPAFGSGGGSGASRTA